MCEGLVEGVAGSVSTPGESPFAVGTAAEAVGATVDPADCASDLLDLSQLSADPADAAPASPSPIPDLDDLLDLGDGPADDAGAEPGAAAGEQLLDLADLGDGPDESGFDGWLDDTPDAAAPAADAPGAASDAEAWNWGAAGDAAGRRPVAPPLDAADAARKSELELRRRVNELLASALVHMEKGERSEALRNLDRLLILDESNETALALKHKLMRQDPEEDTPPPADRFTPRASTAQPGESSNDSPIDGAEPAELLPDGFTPGTPEEPAPDVLGPTRTAELDMSAAKSAAPKPSSAGPLPGLASLPARSKVIYAIGLVTVIVGGLWAMNRFGGSSGGGEPLRAIPPDVVDSGRGGADPAPTGTPGPRPVVTIVAPPDPKQAATQAGPVGVAAVVASEDLPTLLGSASRAMDEGDYAAAVIRYKEVLDREPANRVAARGLLEAGEAYRGDQERRERQARAREAFADGDYHSALRLFYRMPADQTLQRWKFNGWYNLTVGALRTANCHGASDAFVEARGLLPHDEALPQLDRLVTRCAGSPEPAWRLEVDRLTLRSIDD